MARSEPHLQRGDVLLEHRPGPLEIPQRLHGLSHRAPCEQKVGVVGGGKGFVEVQGALVVVDGRRVVPTPVLEIRGPAQGIDEGRVVRPQLLLVGADGGAERLLGQVVPSSCSYTRPMPA